MPSPRISILMAAAVTVALGVAAVKTYLPMLQLWPNALAQEASALCEKVSTCQSTQTRVMGKADRSAVVRHVTFDFRVPPSSVDMDWLRAQLSSVAGSDAELKVEYVVNGAAPALARAAASAPSSTRLRHVGGSK